MCSAHYQQWCRLRVVRPLREAVSTRDRFLRHIDKTDTCWFWTGACDRHGYGRFSLSESSEFYEEAGMRQVGAHQFSLAMALGRWPQPQTLHHCDVRNCVRPDHLYEGSLLDNTRDRHARGPTTRGEAYEKARLTVQDVRDMRAGEKTAEVVATKRGVQVQTARHARDRISWRWLDPEGT